MIVMVMGLPGSGKSFFAERLAREIHAVYISSDRLRKQMISRRTYSAEEKEMVYNEMLGQLRDAIKKKEDLVLDATFYKDRIRKKFREEAGKAGGLFYIEVQAAEPLVKERLGQVRADSEADFNVYKLIKADWEPVQEEHLLLQSANDNIELMINKAKEYLHIPPDD
jgi:predicted kinase